MIDARLVILAKNLINYSCALKKGEKILIQSSDIDPEFAAELVRQAYKVGGIPFVKFSDSRVHRELTMHTDENREKMRFNWDLPMIKDMQAVISVGYANPYEFSDIDSKTMSMISRIRKPMSDIIVNNTKWVILNFPTPAAAQAAGMSTSKYEEFFFDVCNLDYKKMDKAMDPLVKLMEKTDKVRILSKDTDLSFSIKGMKAVKCSGLRNIPDGEVYTAPVKESVNGKITYNVPSMSKNDVKHDDVVLMFKNGKIVDAKSTSKEDINKIFDIDEGARFIGEFALGVNPYIKEPVVDTLFDEKISGSFHFTPGRCYEDCDNGNNSALHWDLICIQTKEYGGGEIYFDDVLIRKDGKFVLKELDGLNPENLK